MKLFRTACMCALLLAGTDARAQLRLPSLPLSLPQQIGPLDTRGLLSEPLRALPDTRALRLDRVTELLRRHPTVLEADPHGEPVLRGRILALEASPAGLAAAAALGLDEERRSTIEPLGLTLVVLRVPAGLSTAAALEALRARDPAGSYDFDHVYTQSGAASGAPAAGAGASARVGLVDGGVDTAHPVFAHARITRWGCAQPHPSRHGTQVAALLVGSAPPFRGGAPDGELYAADIYCDNPAGGAADSIAAALGWLAEQRVGVVNLSVVGPPNALLERAVAAMVKRGHLLVAAVGNDGPAAAPLYPASYPGVVGVTAVDRRGRPLPEAARGPQVMFAAPGHQMVSADPDGAFTAVRGTSFAAPIV
ncbi:MAG TPA: S8 family serine peptidase, partial [Telluria sp.]|nr:S8 family serine peptidase [Telluria sp.]